MSVTFACFTSAVRRAEGNQRLVAATGCSQTYHKVAYNYYVTLRGGKV